MDPMRNPYAPGAGTSPPELAGRDGVLAEANVTLGRIRAGKPAKGQMLLGLRGVGKTVLLNRIERMARDHGYHGLLVEAPEDRRLPEFLVPPLRKVLLEIDSGEKVRSAARAAIRALRNFASAFRVAVGEMEFGVEKARGVADSGNMESDLTDLLVAVAEAARESDTAVALLIDEVQYLQPGDLAALIVALHRIGQRELPLTIFGAGLPQLAGLAGEAKSYAERLFAYPDVGPLGTEAAKDALRAPALRSGVEYDDDALEMIVTQTRGYPYFLQEWGSHAWRAALADHAGRCGARYGAGARPSRRRVLPGAAGPAQSTREGVHARDGQPRCRSPPLGRHRREDGRARGVRRSHSPQPHRQGDALQPRAR
ncbi:MAG TPA: ATP-binding protein [Longimicrobium sp.]|jgi:hypothetical protein|nr:ATP-binding protein [Longimicrobium sp.]